ncbi:MAG: hypothetical protein A3J70_10095 [Elusimicrobia bacterium RIFCSPHIGHO2_02_FULL_61_10]|nr:MAG: hypothetical protein A3J70_10095 [Elusimicrobia bacterium RIFCSPHIGHO2_02_FULL_61_10]
MHSDGHRYGYAKLRVVESGQEGGQALGQIVYADGQGGEQAHAHQLAVVEMLVRAGHAGRGVLVQLGLGRHMRLRVVQGRFLGLAVDLVRVLSGGDEVVYDADEQDAAEESAGVHPVPHGVAVSRHQRGRALVEDLYEGNVEHDPGREAGGDREKTVIRLLRRESDKAAYARGQAGEEGKP